MATLKTNYKDDILDTSVNTQRKYRMVNNADGTISLEDVTVYTQNGDSFGAADINKTNQAVLDLNSSLEGIGATNILQNNLVLNSTTKGDTYTIQESGYYAFEFILEANQSRAYGTFMINGIHFMSHASNTGTQLTTLKIPVYLSKNIVVEIGDISSCTCKIFKLF